MARVFARAISRPLPDRCEGYQHQHAFFAKPEIVFDLTSLPEPVAARRLGVLGEPVLRWNYALDRAASFAGCDRLVGTMGMTAEGDPNADWESAIDATFDQRIVAAASFRCPLDKSGCVPAERC